MSGSKTPWLEEVLRARYTRWIDASREATNREDSEIKLVLARECELLIPVVIPYDTRIRELEAELASYREMARRAHHTLRERERAGVPWCAMSLERDLAAKHKEES